MKNALFLIIAVVIAMASCQTQTSAPDKDLQTLKGWMSGSFSSQEQAEADTNFFDIRLKMAPIWECAHDTVWLYVEQAASWMLDKPYRQRVYRLTKLDDGSVESAVYLINNPLQYAGAYEDPELLKALSPDSIAEKEGCSLILKLKENSYAGSTIEDHCPSNLYGASYATSEVSIKADVLESLDRGYDSIGEQVWGSEYGPYIFRKIIEE